MNRSKRGHASGSNSISSDFVFFGGFAMATTKRRMPRQHTLRREHLQAIGLLITEWAHAEFLFSDILARLIAEPESKNTISSRATIAILGMDARVKLGLMKTIARMRFPEHADGFDKLIDEILSIKKERDLIAHAVWEKGKSPGCIEPVGYRTVGKLKRLSGQRNASQIIDVAWKLREAIQYLGAFLTMNGVAIILPFSALHDMPPEQAPLRRKLMRMLRQEGIRIPRPRKRPPPPRSSRG